MATQNADLWKQIFNWYSSVIVVSSYTGWSGYISLSMWTDLSIDLTNKTGHYVKILCKLSKDVKKPQDSKDVSSWFFTWAFVSSFWQPTQSKDNSALIFLHHLCKGFYFSMPLPISLCQKKKFEFCFVRFVALEGWYGDPRKRFSNL